MASLTNTKIKDTYDGLLKTTDNNALGGTYKLITDGLGNSSGVYLGTGGNVGIGTSDPGTFKLDVAGSARSNFFALRLNQSLPSESSAIYRPATGTFAIVTASAERMRIDSSGRVGIGVTNASSFFNQARNLVVGGSGNIGATIYSSNSGNTFLAFADVADGANSGFNAGGSIYYEHASNAMATRVNGEERMRIESSGLVTIQDVNNSVTFDRYFQTRNALISGYSGTNEGKIYLHRDDVTISSGNVLGELNFSGADGGSLVGANIQGVAAGSWGSTSCASDLVFKTAASGSTSASDRMRIASGGEILIGTSSTRPDEINDNAVAIHNSGKKYQFSTSDFAVLKSSSTGTKVFFRYGTSGSQNTQIGSISYPTTSSVAYNTLSDYRLKENVVDMTGALDRVEQLQPKRFNFIPDPEITFDGFLAHEVQSVIPEAITGEKDAVDDEGNPEYQGIDQSKIVPLLVGAIKELKSEIETLKTQINS